MQARQVQRPDIRQLPRTPSVNNAQGMSRKRVRMEPPRMLEEARKRPREREQKLSCKEWLYRVRAILDKAPPLTANDIQTVRRLVSVQVCGTMPEVVRR